MKRGIVGGSSVAAGAMFLVAFFRGSGPAPRPAAAATSGSAQSVRSTGAGGEKQPTRPGQKKIPAEGPWKASQARFAGWEESECPVSSPEAATNSKDIANLGNVVLKLEKRGSRKAGLDQNDLRSKLWCIPKGEEVRAVIAILPDPMQTNMQLLVDRMIDGIQLAAESAGFVIDHYWLPWEVPPSIEYPDYSSRKAVLQDRQEKQRQPGLLLFRLDRRLDEKQPSTLFIFLVSDTSTTGVNGTQFSNAARYVKQICGDGQRICAHDPITIIGPTFSGSLASLRRLTERRSEDFYAYSGTVSSACAAMKEGLTLQSAQAEACDSTLLPDKRKYHASVPHGTRFHENLHFFRLMHDTESTLAALERWVKQIDSFEGQRTIGRCRSNVAIFSEEGTTYGRVATPQPATGQSDENQKGTTRRPCHVTFEYPREISSLRNAYPGEGQTVASGGTSRNIGFSYLPFNLADREINRTDEPPAFSRSQSPLSKEAVLMSSAAELRRQHVKYVGILGSNILDVLFIASFLRKACPDVRLFVLNSDLLFERDLDNGSYIGTLTFTTYPLILRNLDWLEDGPQANGQHSQGRTLPFVDQIQEGEYNAVLFAISRTFPKPCQGEAAPLESRELMHPFDPGATFIPCKSKLPLWLTAVGYGGYWPITLLRPASGSGTSDPRLKSEDFSPAWKAVAALTTLFALWHILGLLANFWPQIRVGVFVLSGPDIDRRLLFISIASAALVALLGMMLAPILRFSEIGVSLHTLLMILMAASAVSIFAVCILLAICQWLPGIIGRLSWRTAGLAACILAVWPLAWRAIFEWWKLHADDPSHYGFFFAYRSVHLATGVSPFTPMIPLLAGFYCWALFESWRLKFHDQVRPRMRPRNAPRTIDIPSGSIETTVAKSVNDFRLRRKSECALWGLFGLWSLFLPLIHPFQIFELERYGYLYEALFCLLVFLMLSSGFRLGQIWHDLKKLLAELDQSHIRPAFDRVREHSWSPIWHSGVTERAWTNIDRCIERMEEIMNSEPKPPQASVSQFSKLATKVQRELMKNEEMRMERPPSLRIQLALQVWLQRAMVNLHYYWSKDGRCRAEESRNNAQDRQIGACAEIKKRDGYTGQLKLLEEFVALRYVAFIGGVLYQIRLLIIIVAMLFTLVLLSLNIYSFEPHQSLIWSFTAMFAVIGFLIVNMLREVHRDNVLSRITGTIPNELGLDFYLRVAVFGAAPLVTLLATHFPAIGRYLASFLQPGLEALK